MAYVPYSPQMGCKYVLTNGTARAVFNDTTDADYVGIIEEITGLDSADVRESAEDLASAHGGSHGTFYYGRRPVTISGVVMGHASQLVREQRLDKLRRASNAMRADAVLSWTNLPTASYVPMQVVLRRQQPLRVTGNWNKRFQLAMVSEYAQIFGLNTKTSAAIGTTGVILENQGDFPAYPTLTLTGGSQATVILNQTIGQSMRFTAAPPSPIAINTLSRIATAGGVVRNDVIDYVGSGWPHLQMGNNTWMVQGPGSLTVAYLDAWS